MKEKYTTGTGQEMTNVHSHYDCAGNFCPIHNPSDHPLKDARTHWRDDRRIMERICEHGVGHPDPDDRRVKSSWAEAVHGCDGCCTMNQVARQKVDIQKNRGIMKREGDFLSYREAWEDLRSAVEGIQGLYQEDTIPIEYLLDYMDEKEKRLQT